MSNALQNQVREPMPGVVYAPPATLGKYIAAGMLTRETLGEAYAAAFKTHAGRIALATADAEYSYAELDDISDRLAAAFLRLGLKPLDRVVFQIGNCVELVFGFFACLKAGLIPVCTLAAHRSQEIGYIGKHAEARMHFVQGDDPKFDDVAFADQIRGEIPTMRWTVQARGTKRSSASHLRDMIESMPGAEARDILAKVQIDPFQVALFQLSGGTTGVPKIIPRFHNEYVYQLRACIGFNGYRTDDRLFMPLPMMHNLNMGCCFGPFLLNGGMLCIPDSLSVEHICEIFRKRHPTFAAVAGPIVEKLKPAIESGDMPLAHLRAVFSANNAPVLRRILGTQVRQIFGMTEGLLMFVQEHDPQIVQDTMVGSPISPLDEVRLYKPGTEEEITEEGVEGESAFAGPYTIHGYYDAPERNAQTFTSGGMYRSGDLMLFRDIEGRRYYQFRGRTKDVVDRAGEKVNCEEVELLVSNHPAIISTAIIGMLDPVYGERVCAFVTLRGNSQSPSVAELGSFLQQQGLAKFKWPERIEVMAELPVTTSGKLSKPALKEIIAGKLAAETVAQAA